MGFQLRDLLDLALERHVGFLQILNVLVLHLVHVDRFQNLQVLSQDMVAMPVMWSSLLVATEVLVLRNENVTASAHFGLWSVWMWPLTLSHGHFSLECD